MLLWQENVVGVSLCPWSFVFLLYVHLLHDAVYFLIVCRKGQSVPDSGFEYFQMQNPPSPIYCRWEIPVEDGKILRGSDTSGYEQ